MDLSEVSPLTVVECPRCQNSQTVLQRFGPFQLERLMGTGGMGAVYKAVDLTLNRQIALKVVQKNLSHDPALTVQFEREAALTARINHPNVVRVYSTGTAHGMFYIAMELVDRGSLDSVMDSQGCLPESEILRVGIQVAEGLQAAQRAGLVHRDIKPGNILFADHSQAKIVDFGLALQTNQATSTKGELWGTPFYIAPEALAYLPEDFRSDMYALGATLWHALSGAPPCPSTTLSIQELLHLKKKPVDLRSSFPSAHPLTCAVLNRSVSFDPAERHQDYKDLIADLKNALAAVEIRDSATSEALPPAKKKPLFRVLLLLLILSSAGGAWWYLAYRNHQAAIATEPVYQSDSERLSNATALLQNPENQDLAIRRLRLIFANPELPNELQFWTQISLAVGAALMGDQPSFNSALQAAASKTEDIPADLQSFAILLKPNALDAPANAAVRPEWEGVRQLIRGLRATPGQLPQAKAALQIAKTKVSSDKNPASDLLPLADRLLEQIQAYNRLENELKTISKDSLSERQVHLRRADELMGAMHPSAPLRNHAATLLKSAKETPVPVVEKPATPKPPAPSVIAKDMVEAVPQPIAQPAPATVSAPASPPKPSALFFAAREKATTHAQFFRFKDAREEVARFTPTNATETTAKKHLEAMTSASESLFGWAMQEINRGGTMPSPVLRNGGILKSDPVRADEKQILVRTSPEYPPIPIAWADLSPLYLTKLAQFRLTSLPNSPQRAELLWNMGNLLILLGANEKAPPILEEAAKLNPAYREVLPTLLSADPRP